jgi:hypothetical protein
MYYLRMSAKVSRLKKIPNITIRSRIQAEQSVLGRIQRRQLKWYGHLLRTEIQYNTIQFYLKYIAL